MGKIVFIVGGARSGKSSLALRRAQRFTKVAFIATCEGLDAEMRTRIRNHRKARPRHWKTFEEPREVAPLIGRMGDSFECIVLDCLTLLVANLMLSGYPAKKIVAEVKRAVARLRAKKAETLIISNEVGLGIVPDTQAGRAFRDIAGTVNQAVAAAADEVIFTVAGIPMQLKEHRCSR